MRKKMLNDPAIHLTYPPEKNFYHIEKREVNPNEDGSLIVICPTNEKCENSLDLADDSGE